MVDRFVLGAQMQALAGLLAGGVLASSALAQTNNVEQTPSAAQVAPVPARARTAAAPSAAGKNSPYKPVKLTTKVRLHSRGRDLDS